MALSREKEVLRQRAGETARDSRTGRGPDPLQQDVGRLYGQEEAAPTEGTAVGYTQEEANAIRREGKSFRNIIVGIDTTVSDFFNKWRNGRHPSEGDKLEKLYLGKMSADTLQKVEAILGYDIDSRDFIVTNEGAYHILTEHGNPQAEIKKGNLPLTQSIIDALPEIVANPDSIEAGHQEKKSPYRTGVIFRKSLPDGTAVYIQFDNTGRGTFEGRTLYIKEGESPTSGLSAIKETDNLTSKTTEPELSPIEGTRPLNSDLTIAQREKIVKAGPDPLQQDVERLFGRKKSGDDALVRALFGQEEQAPGLVRNEYTGQLKRREAALYDRLARAVGVRLELTESIADGAGNAGAANGVYDRESRTIRLAMDADAPLRAVAAHEITHRVQELAPKEYGRYLEYAGEYLAERTGARGGLEALIAARTEEYARHGVELTREQAMDEIGADFTRELVENAELFRQLDRQDRSVAGRVLDALRDFIRRVKGVFTGEAERDEAARSAFGEDLEQLEWAAAL